MDDAARPDIKPKVAFTLSSEIARSDIKQLACIHVEALKDDDSATIKFSSKEEFRVKIEDMLERQVPSADPSTQLQLESSGINGWFIVKATLNNPNPDHDDQPATIIGWASWRHESPNSGKGTSPRTLTDGERDPKGDDRKLLQFHQGLGASVRQHQSRNYAEWCRKHFDERGLAENGYLSLRACFVLPEFQHQGVGGALVRYGCERADSLMLDTLVTSTQVAKSLYESVGKFEAFAFLEVDLNDFDDKLQGQGANFQVTPRHYRFWFLARMHQ